MNSLKESAEKKRFEFSRVTVTNWSLGVLPQPCRDGHIVRILIISDFCCFFALMLLRRPKWNEQITHDTEPLHKRQICLAQLEVSLRSLGEIWQNSLQVVLFAECSRRVLFSSLHSAVFDRLPFRERNVVDWDWNPVDSQTGPEFKEVLA